MLRLMRLHKWLMILVVTLVLAGGVRTGLVLAQGTGTWHTLAPTGVARQEVSYVQVNGKFYLAGGSTLHQVYDPITNTWANVAPLPVNLDHIQGVALNGRIYYIGGLISWPAPNTNTVYIYNPTTNSFSQGANMTRARGAGGTAVYGGKIYYAGGLHDGNAVNWFDVYDPVANSWTALSNMPTIRDHFHAAVLNGKFYAIGGRDTQINAVTPAVDVYNFATSSWSTLSTTLPTPRGGFAVAVIGTEILVIGGEGGGVHNDVEAYNTVTNTWRDLAPMTTARHGIQAIVCNGNVYLAAGGTAEGSQPSQVTDVLYLNGTTPCGASTDNEPTLNYFTTGTPTLTWNGVTGATGYDIIVYTSPLLLLSASVFAPPTLPADQLAVTVSPALDEGMYYWRVRAHTPTGAPGTWSAVQTFTVDL